MTRVDLKHSEEIFKMSLWKTSKCSARHQEVDAKQLKMRLQALIKQENAEIIQLAIQSILEELSEQRVS
jgi:hypothetical protein